MDASLKKKKKKEKNENVCNARRLTRMTMLATATQHWPASAHCCISWCASQRCSIHIDVQVWHVPIRLRQDVEALHHGVPVAAQLHAVQLHEPQGTPQARPRHKQQRDRNSYGTGTAIATASCCPASWGEDASSGPTQALDHTQMPPAVREPGALRASHCSRLLFFPFFVVSFLFTPAAHAARPRR